MQGNAHGALLVCFAKRQIHEQLWSRAPFSFRIWVVGEERLSRRLDDFLEAALPNRWLFPQPYRHIGPVYLFSVGLSSTGLKTRIFLRRCWCSSC